MKRVKGYSSSFFCGGKVSSRLQLEGEGLSSSLQQEGKGLKFHQLEKTLQEGKGLILLLGGKWSIFLQGEKGLFRTLSFKMIIDKFNPFLPRTLSPLCIQCRAQTVDFPRLHSLANISVMQ